MDFHATQHQSKHIFFYFDKFQEVVSAIVTTRFRKFRHDVALAIEKLDLKRWYFCGIFHPAVVSSHSEMTPVEKVMLRSCKGMCHCSWSWRINNCFRSPSS